MKWYCPTNNDTCPYHAKDGSCKVSNPRYCDDFMQFWNDDHEYWLNKIKKRRRSRYKICSFWRAALYQGAAKFSLYHTSVNLSRENYKKIAQK